MKRFQECSSFCKLIRYRWYLILPLQWLWYSYITKFKVYIDEYDNDEWVHTHTYDVVEGKMLWKLLVGMAQGKMNWTYTMEEVQEKLKRHG